MTQVKIDGVGFQVLSPTDTPTIFDRDGVDDKADDLESSRLTVDTSLSGEGRSFFDDTRPTQANGRSPLGKVQNDHLQSIAPLDRNLEDQSPKKDQESSNEGSDPQNQSDSSEDPLLDFLLKRKQNRRTFEKRYSRKAIAIAAYQKQMALDLEIDSDHPTKDYFLAPRAA